MAFHGIDGAFGSGKSALAVLMALDLYRKGTLVVTNINLERKFFPDYLNFDKIGLLTALRTVNWINDLERSVHFDHSPGRSLVRWKREKFTRVLLIFDEAGADANANFWREVEKAVYEYSNQVRKNGIEFLLVTAAGDQVFKGFRQYVDVWYTIKPLFRFPFFSDFKIVRAQKRDLDGRTVLTESRVIKGKDRLPRVVQIPLDWFHRVFFLPAAFGLYDDWTKNIKDPQKRMWADANFVLDFARKNSLPVPSDLLDLAVLQSSKVELVPETESWLAHDSVSATFDLTDWDEKIESGGGL